MNSVLFGFRVRLCCFLDCNDFIEPVQEQALLTAAKVGLAVQNLDVRIVRD